MCAEPSNQKMDLTTSHRYNLPFDGLNSYPVAVCSLARGSSSWFR